MKLLIGLLIGFVILVYVYNYLKLRKRRQDQTDTVARYRRRYRARQKNRYPAAVWMIQIIKNMLPNTTVKQITFPRMTYFCSLFPILQFLSAQSFSWWEFHNMGNQAVFTTNYSLNLCFANSCFCNLLLF